MSNPIGGLGAGISQRIQNVTPNAAQAAARRALAEFGQAGGPGDGSIPVPFTRPGGESPAFGETLSRALNEVSSAQERSAQMTGAFIRGEPVELHQVTAAAEEASLSLELLVEVRNKFAEAYRTVINMQS